MDDNAPPTDKTMLKIGSGIYEDYEEFRFILNHKIKEMYSYPACLVLELVLLFSERNPEDHPELFKNISNNPFLPRCSLFLTDIREFFSRAIIAEQGRGLDKEKLHLIKKGEREDGLDWYVEPKSAYKLLLNSKVFLTSHGYIDCDALKTMVFGDDKVTKGDAQIVQIAKEFEMTVEERAWLDKNPSKINDEITITIRRKLLAAIARGAKQNPPITLVMNQLPGSRADLSKYLPEINRLGSHQANAYLKRAGASFPKGRKKPNTDVQKMWEVLLNADA